MLSRFRPFVPALRGGFALFLAAFLAAFVVWQAPHTVHHVFEPEAEDREDCALAASADRGQATETTEIVVAELPRSSGTTSPSRRPSLRAVALPERDARAPPPLSS